VTVAAATGKRAQTKDRNRQALLDAAREVFTEMGFGAASIRDVVRRTDLASGTFYNYFPDKETIFSAVLEERTTVLRARLREARTQSGTVEELMRAGFDTYFRFIAEDRPLFEMLRRNAGTVRTRFDTPSRDLSVLELLDDLRELTARGLLSPALDLEALSAAMGGVAFELAIRMSESEAPDVERMARFASELFLGGIERLSAAAP
jgi:AcrR family transcriptional regulator